MEEEENYFNHRPEHGSATLSNNSVDQQVNQNREEDRDDLTLLDLDLSYDTDTRSEVISSGDEVNETKRPEVPTPSSTTPETGWFKQIVAPWSFFTSTSRTSSFDSTMTTTPYGTVAPYSDTLAFEGSHPSVLRSSSYFSTYSPLQKDASSEFDQVFDEPFMFTAVFLAYWDNLVGPKIEKTWPADVSAHQETLLYVSRYTLNSEIARPTLISDQVEMKFSILGDQHVAVASFLFTGVKHSGPPSKHAVCMIVPDTDIHRFMLYFPIIQNRIPPIIDRYRILQQNKKPSALNLLSTQLTSFVSSLQDLNVLSVPSEIKLNDTIFGPMYEGYFEKSFQKRLVTSFLQTHGCAIVIGSDVTLINVIIKSLAMFLSPSERKRCRLARSDCHRLMPELMIQGILLQDVSEQLSEVNLLEATFPVTVTDLTSATVQRTPIYHEYCMVRNQWLDAELDQLAKDGPTDTTASMTIAIGGLLQIVKESAAYIDAMLAELTKLPYALRTMYLNESKRLLTRKAVALIRYCEAEMATDKILTQQAVKKIRMDLNLLDNNLFWIILAIAEKVRPGSFADFMEDPISMEEKFRAMIESF